MANRNFFQFPKAYQRDIVSSFPQVSFGASGAPTLISAVGGINNAMSKGIASISRLSAGKYRIVLQDNFGGLLMVRHVFQNATAPAAPGMYIVADNSSNLANPTIDIQFNAAGTATDPGNGEVVLMEIISKNTPA